MKNTTAFYSIRTVYVTFAETSLTLLLSKRKMEIYKSDWAVKVLSMELTGKLSCQGSQERESSSRISHLFHGNF